MAPVAAFDESDFTLAEDSERMVTLDINAGRRGARIPPAATASFAGMVSVRVSNHNSVAVGAGAAGACPTGTAAGTMAFAIDLEGDTAGTAQWAAANFANTGVLTTVSAINALAGAEDATLTVKACGDTTSFRDPMLTLTIMASSLGDGFSGRVKRQHLGWLGVDGHGRKRRDGPDSVLLADGCHHRRGRLDRDRTARRRRSRGSGRHGEADGRG